ncbi:hypothetical protein PAMP_009366 [Pampus punctatissimus]
MKGLRGLGPLGEIRGSPLESKGIPERRSTSALPSHHPRSTLCLPAGFFISGKLSVK